MFRFEKLDVWHEAIGSANDVYTLSEAFPADERFGLTSQIRRAAVSISSNIAEGRGRASDADFVQFLSMAYGSVMETISQTHIAMRRGYIKAGKLDEVRKRAERVSRMPSGLRRSLLKPSKP